MRGIPIIPICHSGLSVTDLQMPLSLLQAVELGMPNGLKLLYGAIAKQLNALPPALDDLEDRLHTIAEVEERFRGAGTRQYECFIDVVIPRPGHLESPTIPDNAKVVSDERSLSIFGLGPSERRTWADIVRAAQKVPDTRWLTQLQTSVFQASKDDTFDPVQAIYHAPTCSYQPQLARKVVLPGGETRFHVHFVDTVVAPLADVQNDFGLLATLLRLGLRFRYEVIERFLRRANVEEGGPDTLRDLRRAIEIIETDAYSRGAQNFDPASVSALFETPEDRQEIAQVRREWEEARCLLFRTNPDPSVVEVASVIATMRRINVRFMTLGTRRYHEMVKARWQ